MSGNYNERVAKAVELAGIKPGSVYNVEVKHDEWCELLLYARECNCDPAVTIKLASSHA